MFVSFRMVLCKNLDLIIRVSNRPFHFSSFHGGHFEFINLKHIMGFPGANTRNVSITGYVTAYAVNSYSSLSIMGDQPDQNKKEFSREELNMSNVEKLRKYLKDRGIVITGDIRKRDLISKVYYTFRPHL